MKLQVCTFKWSKPGYRSTFAAEHVAILRRMVARHYPDPHEFVLFSDRAAEDERELLRIDPNSDIKVFQLWDDLASVVNPSGHRNPSCYRRLRIFARNVDEWLGERIVTLDLDTVITGDMRPVWNRKEDFVIWADTNHANPYNGSMILFSAGARPELWEDFDPVHSPGAGQRLGYFGSDQAWIAARLGPNEARWTQRDGVYSFRNHIKPRGGVLPSGARIVFFHGRYDPWTRDAKRIAPWIETHYK